jgi:asparagine synthase (glutamine-hydrolysing)
MCGIAGVIDFKNKISIEILSKMVKELSHRGPDDNGFEVYNTDFAQIGFGQARLSIIDLSNAGHQPMHFNELSIVFNGEIYNFEEIKEILIKSGHYFSTGSDTEVILHSYVEWGNNCVDKFIGMFSFVILDRKINKIIAFRDRAGVKPFYYYNRNGLFLFASELKSFHKHPEFEKIIDHASLGIYFNYGYISAPHTIFKNTYKLEPGHILTLDLISKNVSLKKYWDVVDFYKKTKLKINYDDAKEELHRLIKSACNYRMVADVPVGVFLSGGFDSSIVAAILQKDRTEKIKTFTIGFEEGNNEAPFAKETANFLGTDHSEAICTTKEAQDIIPQLPFFFDEPFADSSAIPTTLVSQFAKKKVTVALSADAGDEIFCGYETYSSLYSKLKNINKIPNSLKPIAKRLFQVTHNITSHKNIELRHKLDGLSKSLDKNNFTQATTLNRTMSSLPQTYIDNLFLESSTPYKSKFEINTDGFSNEIEIAMAIDYQVYLQNDILTKIDRATMSVSLEGREPLLDQRIIEFAAQIPFEYKFDGYTSKRILKDIVYEYIPKNMMDRPKTGFSLPVSKWLRGDLNYLIEEYLNPTALAESKILNVEFITKQVQLFKSNKLHYTTFIWKILMFQMWFSKWMK